MARSVSPVSFGKLIMTDYVSEAVGEKRFKREYQQTAKKLEKPFDALGKAGIDATISVMPTSRDGYMISYLLHTPDRDIFKSTGKTYAGGLADVSQNGNKVLVDVLARGIELLSSKIEKLSGSNPNAVEK